MTLGAMSSPGLRPLRRGHSASTMPIGPRLHDRRGALDRLLARSPLQTMAQLVSARRVAVLAYHAVDDAERFARQMRYVKQRLRPLSLEDFGKAQRERRRPERGVLVTFDDGDRTVLDIALPILRDLQLPAAVFPIAELIGTDQPPWWEEVADLASAAPGFAGPIRTDPATLIRRLKRVPDATRRRVMGELRRAAGRSAVASRQLRPVELLTLESNGIEIGNHTLSHPCLPRCDDRSVETEVEAAHERLTAILGHPPVAFCYPNGDWDARAEPVLRRLGYRQAFLFDHRLCDPRSDHPLRVPRIRTDATASMDRFVILASGLHPALHRLRGLA